MDKWQAHVRLRIDEAKSDVFVLLDYMQALSGMEVQGLIPVDISIDLFDLIDNYTP